MGLVTIITVMRLRKIISGGQTGADRTGLECARELGLETGGTATKGYRTENGPDLSLKDFGLVEDDSPYYPPRTIKNVKDADATVLFGDPHSSGSRLTIKTCGAVGRPIFINPVDLRPIAEDFAVVNVAGNRKSVNPGVVDQVRAAFATLSPAKREGNPR